MQSVENRLSTIDYRLFENPLTSCPSKFWKYVRDLKQNLPIPSSVHFNGISSAFPLESVQLFSSYFSSVYNQSLLTVPPTTFPHKKLPFDLPTNVFFTQDDMLLLLSSLKNTVSSGPDGVSAHLLYNCRYSIVYQSYLLFRRSLDESIFPSVWKIYSVSYFVLPSYSDIRMCFIISCCRTRQ